MQKINETEIKISILTPSNRNFEGLQLVGHSIKNNLNKFEKQLPTVEWLIGSPVHPGELPYPYTWVEDPPKQNGDYWVLNKLYNKMLRQSKGELILSVQDFTAFEDEGLLKFWLPYTQKKNGIFSGVGNKFEDSSFKKQIWTDPRINPSAPVVHLCNFHHIEGNYCALPKAAILTVGGFDEELDKFAGMDWYSVLERISLLSEYEFYLIQANHSFSVVHKRYEQWEERNALHGFYQKRKEDYLTQGAKLSYFASKAKWINPAKNSKHMMLDIGCGNTLEGENQAQAGFVLQDVDPNIPGIDLACDIKDLELFIQAEHCKTIRASHILEHFGTFEVDNVLKILFKLLEPKGELEVSVPNFKWHAQLVLEGKEEAAVFYAFGGQKDPWDYHKTGFTAEILKKKLTQTGFQITEIKDQTSLEIRASKP